VVAAIGSAAESAVLVFAAFVSGFMVVALVLVLMVRPDPRRIADILHTGEPPPSTTVPLREIVRRPG
jgi:hypothetical protein